MEEIAALEPGPNACPELMFVHGEKLEKQVFYNVVSKTGAASFSRSIPELINTPLVMATNFNGWLILKNIDPDSLSPDELRSIWDPFRTIYVTFPDDISEYPASVGCIGESKHPPSTTGSVRLSLWNPVTLQSIGLPLLELPESECIHGVLLTKNPSDPECILVLEVGLRSVMFCYVNGDDRIWIHRSYHEEVEEVLRDEEHKLANFGNLVACGDRIFISSYLAKFILMEIQVVEPKDLVVSPLGYNRPRDHVMGTEKREHILHWVACCGDLFVIHVTFGGICYEMGGFYGSEIISFSVLKLDFSDMTWNRVDSCPNAAFFISNDQAMSCPVASTESSKAGNRVHFITNYAYGDPRPLLYTYHIQEKTVSVSLFPTPDNASKPFWIFNPDAQALAKAQEDYLNGLGDADENVSHVPSSNDKITAPNCYEEKSLLNELPVEILRIISSHLINLRDYLNFRASSKLCLSVSSIENWKSVTRDFVSIRPSPLLMIPSLADKGVSTLLDPVSNNRYYIRTSWDDEHSRICYSSKGWLLMHSDYFSEEERIPTMKLRLYNPITKSTIWLPELIHVNRFFFIGSPSFHCLVVALSLWDRLMWSTELIDGAVQNDERQADLISNAEENHNIHMHQSNVNPVFLNEHVYFLLEDGNLASFCLTDESPLLRLHNLELPCREDSFVQNFLAESDGRLLSIYVGSEWEWLRVYRLDESGSAWEGVDNLNNKNIYLSAVSCIVQEAESLEMGNRIYLPRFHQGHIVYYSFKTCRFHSGGGESNPLASYYDSKEQLYCSWFEPSWK